MEPKFIDVTKSPVIDVLKILLQDKTTEKNIIWATDAYSKIGEKSEMTMNAILNRPEIICPRVFKSKETQILRARKKAEVFTPAWLVNKMNNFIDEDWFGRKNVFNVENSDNTWTTNDEKIEFSENKNWQKYIHSRRLEITCGEGSYIVSRYDAVGGNFILTKDRVGILDRKMKIVNQNTTDISDWKIWAFRAFKSVYGYEYQGDNTLIARINLLMSFVEYYEEKFGIQSSLDMIEDIANVIAKNIWQMDGLTNNKPLGAPYKQYIQQSLFDYNGQDAVDIPSKIFDYKENKYIYFSELKEMKSVGKKLFDYVIGNPPYQEEDGGAKASSKPVYNLFVEEAKKLNPDGLVLIIPARWFSGGKSLDAFRDEMLHDRHIRYIVDYFDSTECFPTMDISGGVCIFSRNGKIEGDCIIESHHGNKVSIMERPLLEPNIDIFIRFNESVSIVKKVLSKNFESFSEKISSRKPFGLATNVDISDERLNNDFIPIYAYPNNGYIKRSKITTNEDLIDKMKVCISYAYGERGNFPYQVLGKPFICEARACCTETYLILSTCDDIVTAKNIISYVMTRFCRFLVLQKKNTQHATKNVYKFVPLQDFTQNSDIDWTKSVAEIDRMLYKKYGLSEEEIEFIETHVKEMM